MHDEILTSTQKRVLRKLAPLATKNGFYLASGTGLALQLGHRQSIDFDYFNAKEFFC
jgi:hypothetical protein